MWLQGSKGVQLGLGCTACLGGPGRALGGWGHAGQLSRAFLDSPRPSGPPDARVHSVASNVPLPADDALISDFTVRTVPLPVLGCTFELGRGLRLF